MADPLARLSQRILSDIQEEVSSWISQIMKDAFNPVAFAAWIRKMGIAGVDPAHLAGILGQQPAFDPYRALGLDRSAGDEQVKRRYRELLRHLHPDTAGLKGTAFFLQVVMAAYEQISRERGWK